MSNFHDLPISKLKLDKQNPRIPKSRRNEDNLEILKDMWYNFSLEELIISITQNSFIKAEPLMVIKDVEAPNTYIVVEGNRRLSAVMLLTEMAYREDLFFVKKLELYPLIRDLKNLPCYVYDNRDNIRTALAVRHITGIKKWEPRERAEYVNLLYNDHGDISTVTKIVGSKSNHIGISLYAYRWLEHITTQQEDNVNLKSFFENKFSLLILALGQSSIKTFVNITEKWTKLNYNISDYAIDSQEYKNMLLLCEWLAHPSLIVDSRQITGSISNPVSLKSILNDEKATKYLKDRTEADSLESDTLRLAYYRISVDNTLEIRFEDLEKTASILINLYMDKVSGLDSNVRHSIKNSLQSIVDKINSIPDKD